VAPDGRTCWVVEESGLLSSWGLGQDDPVLVPLGAVGVARGTGAISQDGARVAAVVPTGPADGARERPPTQFEVRVWDAAGVRIHLRVPPRRAPDPRAGRVPTLELLGLDSGGRRAALLRYEWPPSARGGTDPDLTIWDVDRGTVLRHLKLDGGVAYSRPLFAPDGNSLALVPRPHPNGGPPPPVLVFQVDADTGPRVLAVLSAGALEGRGARFSPDGRYLAAPVSAGAAAEETKLCVWDLARGVYDLKTVPFGNQVVWSPDGKRVALAGGDPGSAPTRVCVVDPTTGGVPATLEQPLPGPGRQHPGVVALAFSPDRRRLAAVVRAARPPGRPFVAEEIRVWDTGTGKLVLTHPLAPFRTDWWSAGLAFSADGRGLLFRDLSEVPVPGPEGRWDSSLTVRVLALGSAPAEELAK
jgi:WD40 repeat protein